MSRAARRSFALSAVFVAVLACAAAAAAPVLRFTSPPYGLAIEGRSLWVSLADDGVLLRLDLRTGRRLARIEVNRTNRLAFGGGSLATSGRSIWIAAPVHVGGDPSVPEASGWIGRFDTRRSTLRITQTEGDQPAQVAVGAAGIWVSGGRTLWQVDPRTGRVIATMHLKRYLGAIAVTRGAVWVVEPNAGLLVRVAPRTRKIVSSTSIGTAQAGSSLAVGTRMWTTTDRGVVGLDRATGRIVKRIPLSRPSAVAVAGTRVWALAPNGLYAITGRKARKRLGLPPEVAGLLVAARGSVWLSDGATNTLRRFAG